MIETKNIQSKKHTLGQFFTPASLVEQLVMGLPRLNSNIIEPSFGGGAFLTELAKHNSDSNIIGIEIDKEWFDCYNDDSMTLVNSNFYDYNILPTGDVSFVGNVPFRTPAYSLSTHGAYVKQLAKKYGVTGIREEAVFFIIKTIDLLLENKSGGDIHYIIPASIIKNDSKFYKKFKDFLKKYTTITEIKNIDKNKFDNVSQELLMISMVIGGKSGNYELIVNGGKQSVDSVLNLESTDIPFQDIFKKTYLGSIPAESFLVSSKDEPKESFANRLQKIFNNPHDIDSLSTDLYYNGYSFLKILNGDNSEKIKEKLNTISTYISKVKEKIDISIFSDIDNYKIIKHRNSSRFYFRNKKLKNCGFVYELNPLPCKSFYFTSNPSESSTDYFGYCEYDITRNSSPGCCRTIPLLNIKDNITESFKEYWIKNTHRPVEDIPKYIIHVSKSQWYKQQKKLKKRMYFCVPLVFMTDFNVVI